MANRPTARHAEFATCNVCSVLHLDTDVHPYGSYAEHARARRNGAHAVMGQLVTRTRRFLDSRCKSLAPRTSRFACDRRHLLSIDFACSGGACIMLRPSRLLALLILLACAISARAHSGGELHFCLHGEPKTFNPILVEDEASENVRYLTGGVLIRLNRQTQSLEPALATSWSVSRDRKTITFHLRKGVLFSDGTPFASDDVAYTFRLLLDPNTHSSTGDAFRSGEGSVEVRMPAKDIAVITF